MGQQEIIAQFSAGDTIAISHKGHNLKTAFVTHNIIITTTSLGKDVEIKFCRKILTEKTRKRWLRRH